MPKPYKLNSTRPLPPDAEIVDVDGKPHVRVREARQADPVPADAGRAGLPPPLEALVFRRAGRDRDRPPGEGVRRLEGDGATRRRQGTSGVAGAGRVHRPGRGTRPAAARRPPERLRRRPGSEGKHRRPQPGDGREDRRAAFRVRLRLRGRRGPRQGVRMARRPAPAAARRRDTARRDVRVVGRGGAARRQHRRGSPVRGPPSTADRGQRPGPPLAAGDGSGRRRPGRARQRPGHHEPLHPRRPRLLPLARADEADRFEPPRFAHPRERRRGRSPRPPRTDGRRPPGTPDRRRGRADARSAG